MRLSMLLFPAGALALLSVSALQAALPGAWGPTDPTYQLVMQYRTDAYVLDHGLTREDCTQALPYGDNVKRVHFSCEVEG